MYGDQLFGSMLSSHTEEIVKKAIRERDNEIDRLKGQDGEKDAEICKKIRENIMAAESPEGINQLTGALLNMMKVIAVKVDT